MGDANVVTEVLPLPQRPSRVLVFCPRASLGPLPVRRLLSAHVLTIRARDSTKKVVILAKYAALCAEFGIVDYELSFEPDAVKSVTIGIKFFVRDGIRSVCEPLGYYPQLVWSIVSEHDLCRTCAVVTISHFSFDGLVRYSYYKEHARFISCACYSCDHCDT